MYAKIFAALLGAAVLASPALAMQREQHERHHHSHGLDGRSYTVEVVEKHHTDKNTDHISFADGRMESDWLKAKGFEAGWYESGHDHFSAWFRKGEERVSYDGHFHGDVIHGDIKWGRHHEGGHTHFRFHGTAGATTAAAPAAPAEAPAAAPAAPASLYQRLGGHAAISAVINDFVDVLVKDPVQLANPTILKAFKKTNVPVLKEHLTDFVAMATGGPEKYTGRSNKAVHKNMGIGEKEWGAAVNDLVGVLNKYKVPQKEQDELIAVVATTKGDVVTRP